MAVNNTSIKLTEFSSMSKQQRESRVNALFDSAIKPTPDQLSQWREQVDDEIQQYESQYKMSSEEMLRSVQTGRPTGFPDICSWLMLLKTRGQIERKYGSSRSK